jgi:REP element-mobilizing transposase RayT
MKLHRNSFKRIIFEDAVYFVTSKTNHNYPYFRERIFCDLFVENLRLCKQMKGFLLYGWVLNFDHFHLLVQPNDEFNISKIIQFLKRTITHNINYVIGYTEGANNYSRLQFHGILDKYRKQFIQKYPDNHKLPKFRWQDSFHDNYICNETDFNNHLDYIAYNPEKHNLPENWQYIFTNQKYFELTEELI